MWQGRLFRGSQSLELFEILGELSVEPCNFLPKSVVR
jgi:hypothetical protein